MDKKTVEILMEMTDTKALKEQGYLSVLVWGKDHWSLLGYLGTLAPDEQDIDPQKMRDKRRGWETSYGTRLRGYVSENSHPNLQVQDHDDWDCLRDMEAEGLVVRATGASMTFGLTPKGHEFVAALNRFKSEGGNFASFGISEFYNELLRKWGS